MKNLPKIIVILGPTASGKTDLALSLAKKFNGEIVSADSRQIYKKMSIGTAKPAGEWQGKNGGRVYVTDGVPHYLVDIVDPGKDFSLSDYKQEANKAIGQIISRGKLPIIVGGTGLYIWALVDNLAMPQVAPNKKLRHELEVKDLSELVELLTKLDPDSAQKIDLKNPRRVLRALEVAILTGESFLKQKSQAEPLYNALQIGLLWPREDLYARIEQRIDKMMEQGLIKEVEALNKQKYGWNLPSMSSLGYKQIGAFLRGEISLEQAVSEFKRDSRRYAKKQMTWFKRDKRIEWIDKNHLKSSEKLVRDFILPRARFRRP